MVFFHFRTSNLWWQLVLATEPADGVDAVRHIATVPQQTRRQLGVEAQNVERTDTVDVKIDDADERRRHELNGEADSRHAGKNVDTGEGRSKNTDRRSRRKTPTSHERTRVLSQSVRTRNPEFETAAAESWRRFGHEFGRQSNIFERAAVENPHVSGYDPNAIKITLVSGQVGSNVCFCRHQ